MKRIHTLSSLIFLFSFCILISCNQESSDSLFKSYPQLVKLEETYNTNQDVPAANDLLRGLLTTISSPQMESDKMVDFLEYGYSISSKHAMTSRSASFLVALIREDYKNENTAQRLFDLSAIMSKLKKENVALILSHGLNSQFKDFEKNSELTLDLPEGINNVDELIADLGTKIFEDPDNSGINRASSLKYVDACEAYALVFPNNPNSPANLFKAAEVAKSLRTFPKSLTLYDWIIEDYPDYEKTATSLFLKGFIIENNLGDDEKARQVYNEFVKRFPSHELVDDVQFLLENLGKTDEEILEMIEQKRQDRETES